MLRQEGGHMLLIGLDGTVRHMWRITNSILTCFRYIKENLILNL